MTTITTQLADALRGLLDCSKSDAWNGSMKLDDALQDSLEALAAYDTQQNAPEDFRAWLKSPSASGRPMGAMMTADEQRIARMAWDAGRLAAYGAQRARSPVSTAIEHTAEPWAQRGFSIVTKDGEKIIADGVEHFDLCRIVACVNACAGIPTAQLEGFTGWENHPDNSVVLF